MLGLTVSAHKAHRRRVSCRHGDNRRQQRGLAQKGSQRRLTAQCAIAALKLAQLMSRDQLATALALDDHDSLLKIVALDMEAVAD